MSRPDFVIPDFPAYNPVIPTLLDQDPASATNTFNPLFLHLITNAHAIKLAADALQLQVSVLTGYNVSRMVNAHADLPVSPGLPPGTLFAVMADETRGGITTVYELNNLGQWIFKGEMASNINAQISSYVAMHNTDPQAHEGKFQTLQNEINLLMYLIQQMQPTGTFLGSGAFLGDDAYMV